MPSQKTLYLLFSVFIVIACSTTKETKSYSIPSSPSSAIDTLSVFKTDQVDKSPELKSSYLELLSIIQYPAEARRVGATGKVIVKLVVTPSGEGISHYIESSPHPSLSKESIRIANKATFKPGMKNGKAVYSWFTLPIEFQLGK